MGVFDIVKTKRYYKELILSDLSLLEELNSITSFLGDASDTQRLWHIKNGHMQPHLCNVCGKNETKFSDNKNRYNKTCSEVCRIKLYESTNLERFGVANPSSVPKFIKKRQYTCIQKFGTDNFSKTAEFKNVISGDNNKAKLEATKIKSRETNLSRYGTDNAAKLDSVKLKIKLTNRLRYGADYFILTESGKELIKSINSKNFGVQCSLMRPDIKEKIAKINLELNRNAFIQKLGDDFELIEYNKICKIQHRQCGEIFTINRGTLHSRFVKSLDLCVKCNPMYKQSSKAETDIHDYIKSIYTGTVIRNHRIGNTEIDIFIPELNLGIEYNGVYFHSSTFKHKNFHKDKTTTCLNAGIRLMHIWEDEWINQKQLILGLINGTLGLYDKIYARKCEIKEISNTEAKDFLNNSHLQGYVGFKYGLGLYYNNELIQIMTFTNRNGEYEISRLCTKLGMVVVGGTKKLYKHFLDMKKPKTVISYSSLDKFTGEIYGRLGLEFISRTEPSYFYVSKSMQRFSRNKFQKHKLVDMGMDSNKSESEIMTELGYFKIYNSGNLKFRATYS